MAKKKKAPPVVHSPTKRQLTHWQKQKRRQRVIAWTGLAVIAAVIILVLSGLYFQWYLPDIKPLRETVAEVNGKKFDMAYYLDALRFQSGGQAEYVEFLLEPVLTNIQQLELMRQEALKLGISVSDDDVKKEIEDNQLPNNQAVRDIARGQLLSTKLQTEYFDPQIPVSAEQRHVLAMFLESQSRLDEIKAKIESGQDFGQLAGDLSLDDTTKTKKGDLGFRPEGILDGLLQSTVIEKAVFGQEVGTWEALHDADKTKKGGYWLVKVTEKKEDLSEVHVFGMLLSSNEEALSVKARLDAGEDFTTLAKEFAQNWTEDKKCDMDWIKKDVTYPFKDYIFSPDNQLNSISQPVYDEGQNTKGGYWLFKVVDSGVQEIAKEDRDTLIGQAFNDWLTTTQADPQNKLVSYLDEGKKVFAVNHATTS